MPSRKNIVFTSLFVAVSSGILIILSSPAHAVCNESWGPSFDDMLGNINWHCYFPVRIAGAKIDPFKDDGDNVDRENVMPYASEFQQRWKQEADVPHKDSGGGKVFCQCDTPGLIGTALNMSTQTGVRVSFWEPVRVVEVVKDSWCFPFLFSTDLGEEDKAGDAGQGLRKSKDGSNEILDEASRTAFWQVHYYIFPVLAVLELLTDFICMDMSGFDLAYVTEVDPRWDDEELGALLSPESVLFSNPVTQLACIPDAMATTLKSTIDLLYWCQGGWDTIFPLSGYVSHTSYIESEAAAMGRTIFNLHRNFVLWGTIGENALCQRYPMPIWRKSQYRWQLMWPRRDNTCRVLGESDLFWSSMKNPPTPKTNMDNFVNLLWRKRNCCAR